jgi:hypothetical protein
MKFFNKRNILLGFIFIIFLLYFYYYSDINNYTAIIIEPREHKALSFVLRNFLSKLSNNWNIIIMHGNKNKSYVENIVNNELLQYKNRVKLINLNVDNLTIPEYSKLFYSEEFYDYIPTETFLVFQTDSMICDNGKDLINNYIKYDYVGAPWSKEVEPRYNNNEDFIGNGGLSLRKKSAMLAKIRNNIQNIKECSHHIDYEDMFFAGDKCGQLYKPNLEEAKYFSNESIYTDKSFGVHKPWYYFNKNDIDEKIKTCKGLDKLIELNQ